MSVVLTVVFLLLGVAFFTLLERKLLSYSALRLGPNKVFFMGLVQPLLDGLKLFLKPLFHLTHSGWVVYSACAWLAFFLNLLLWQVMDFAGFYLSVFQSLWLLAIMGLGSYTLLMSGWSSMSKYGQLGAWRSLAQVLSFEVALVLVVLLMFVINGSFCWSSTSVGVAPLVVMPWVMMVLAETQRAPLDLAEAESELVSGYNVEYGSFNFVLLFLAEYGNVLMLSVFSLYLFGGFLIFWICLILFFRSCFPRVRYDWVMGFMWLSLMPLLVGVWFVGVWLAWL